MMALSGVRISWLILARKSDFGRRRAFRLAARGDQVVLGLLPVRDVAEHGAEFLARLAQAAHRHEQWDQAAVLFAAAISRPSWMQARDAGPLQAIEIVDRDVDAVGGEQVTEALALELVAVISEQRLGASVRGEIRAARSSTITPSVAVSRMAVASSACARACWSAASVFAARVRAERHRQQRKGCLAVPRHLQQSCFGADIADAPDW